MPLQDVKVTIDLKKPAGLFGLGKPLILAEKAGASAIKNYSDITAVKADFAENTNAYKKAAAVFAQKHRPANLAIATYDPAATGEGAVKTAKDAVEKYYDHDWFFLLTADAELTEQIEVADYVEGKKFKMYVVKTTTAADRNAFKTKAYDFVIDFYHPKAEEQADAALVGELGSQTVGSITWKFKTLTGITPIEVNADELNLIHEDGAIAYVTKAGIPQTSEGIVCSGEYIDVMHGLSWLKVDAENRIQSAFTNNKKIPFDHRGISLLSGQLTTTFRQGYSQGIIAEDDDGNPLYTIIAKSRSEVPAEERAARIYNGLFFSLELAGAIHGANITGEVLV
ncbi:hypothetical protein C0966_00740 [Bacillus methanolicus]|uniref:DUF3383 family protein n=1 Tax=Bacillus methanolicus TaxID=1471 RepID=UPI00237FFE16|nr:DUF3383 family protein [Bacillus methanolicus]MDE3837935.1 hypothetical protein [Bacillus methanolicus]